MTYALKEIFYTLQGEGAHSGRAAVFCRFSGCNLWSGREPDRSTALCRFCDTDFFGTDGPGGGRFPTANDLADAIESCWMAHSLPDTLGDQFRFTVCTGGEPLLQLDSPLIEALHERHFTVAIETNGTRPVPPGVDWVCVSPKAGTPLSVTRGDELKLVFPQEGASPEEFTRFAFRHFFLQPMDGPNKAENLHLTIAYCLSHPRWRLSLQTHKLIGLP